MKAKTKKPTKATKVVRAKSTGSMGRGHGDFKTAPASKYGWASPFRKNG